MLLFVDHKLFVLLFHDHKIINPLPQEKKVINDIFPLITYNVLSAMTYHYRSSHQTMLQSDLFALKLDCTIQTPTSMPTEQCVYVTTLSYK